MRLPVPTLLRPPQDDADPYGLEHRPGGPHHRAYVGPPADYDRIAGIVFGVLFATGLREVHAVLDVGCGSLRVGRLLIPYLRPERYFGIEPNTWLVREGIRREVGRDLVRMKRPRFSATDTFAAEVFGVRFDRIVLQSILSHCYDDLAVEALTRLAPTLADDGLLLATYVPGDPEDGAGWRYPACTTFHWPDVERWLDLAGLVGAPLEWPHPRQRWFVAGHAANRDAVEGVAAAVHVGTWDAGPHGAGHPRGTAL